MKTIEGDGWRVAIPDDLIATDHRAFGYESGALARGWVGEAPMTVIVQVKPLTRGFNDWVRHLHRLWLQHQVGKAKVKRAKDAARIDGVIESDSLGTPDNRESCTMVVAKRKDHVWSLTVRTRPEDGIGDAVDRIVKSFELT